MCGCAKEKWAKRKNKQPLDRIRPTSEVRPRPQTGPSWFSKGAQKSAERSLYGACGCFEPGVQSVCRTRADLRATRTWTASGRRPLLGSTKLPARGFEPGGQVKSRSTGGSGREVPLPLLEARRLRSDVDHHGEGISCILKVVSTSHITERRCETHFRP